MVVELSVENVAIIDRATLSLGPGFTVLTGETGAGKSLLVDAIELALGARADSELVRAGANRALVALTVDLSSNPLLNARCAELGFESDDGCLYIQRELFSEGKSQARVQGRMAPIGALRALGQILVDLHGQHEHQSLFQVEGHLGYLDAWIGEEANRRLSGVAEAFRSKCELERKLAAVREGSRDREQRADLLRYQVQEIESVAPVPSEMEDLENQLSRLKNAAALSESAAAALEAIDRGESSAHQAIGGAIKGIENAVRLDASMSAILEPLREAIYSLEESTEALRAYESSIEADPSRLEEIAERIDALRRLRRKYGDAEAGVLAFLEKAKEELHLLEGTEENEGALAEKIWTAKEELDKWCAELSEVRRSGASEFGEQVQRNLRDLAMDVARFEVRIELKVPDETGADSVEFAFSANPGEPARPLAKIASGGEVSRVMLALKTVLAGKGGVPTLIFDELEAGLGGSAATAVAKKLEESSAHYQIVVISHLPQIASRATSHFKIEKVEEGGRMVTRLRALDEAERVQEIARMLAGEEIGESAVVHARELLAR